MTEAEFLPLFDRYRSMVYGLALSYTRSPQDAEDICQEVFLTLLEKPPAPGKERPWLAKVTVNRCRDLLASPWKKRREEDDAALERLSFQEPEEAGLFAALGELEPEYRALLHLRYYEGFSAAELARQLGTTAPALSARLYRAKRQAGPGPDLCPPGAGGGPALRSGLPLFPTKIGGNCYDCQAQTPHPHSHHRRRCGRRPHRGGPGRLQRHPKPDHTLLWHANCEKRRGGRLPTH